MVRDLEMKRGSADSKHKTTVRMRSLSWSPYTCVEDVMDES